MDFWGFLQRLADGPFGSGDEGTGHNLHEQLHREFDEQVQREQVELMHQDQLHVQELHEQMHQQAMQDHEQMRQEAVRDHEVLHQADQESWWDGFLDVFDHSHDDHHDFGHHDDHIGM